MATTEASSTFFTSTPERQMGVEVDENKQLEPHGISILKDLFPEHGETPKASNLAAPATGRLPLQLVNSIPSPARAGVGKKFQGGAQLKAMPCVPPMHSPAPLAAPPMPPPPPFLPASSCQAQQELQHGSALEQTFGSYRERLRAGGRGAFQRAIDAGLMPKTMKQEWSSLQQSSTPAQGFLPKPEVSMQYSTLGDSQQMWNGTGQMASNDGWCSPASQPQMQQQPCMQQQAPQMQQPQMMSQSMQVPSSMPSLPPQVLLQAALPQDQAQLTPTAQGDAPHMQADFNRCMAIVMPQVGQFPCDREMMAAQLKAAADCQCYQD